MKNFISAAFIAAAAATEVATEVAAEAIEKVEPVEDNLLDLQVCESAEADRIYKKTDRDVIAANKRILQTSRTCMKWVRQHRRHNEVCRYCAKNVTPSIKWKFYRGVWYRWWSGKWHYYGPSKRGHGGAWKWYGGFWHYKGYVFKYTGGRWYRFFGGRWHYYKHQVDQNPKPPKTKPYCISVYKLVRHGLPASMSVQRIPRCRAGRTLYMWEGSKKCSILGGRKYFTRMSKCKKGSLHKWQRVRRCTRSVLIRAGRINYRTGHGYTKVRAVRQAYEGRWGTCTGTLYYGKGKRWYKMAVNGKYKCHNWSWGDPWVGMGKQCYCLARKVRVVRQAWEGSRSFCKGTVRYGMRHRYVFRRMKGNYSCTNGTFGDPYRGVRKICQCLA